MSTLRGGGGSGPSATPSTSCTSEESTSVSSEASQCSEGHGAKTGSNGRPSEKLTYEKIFYRIRQLKSGGAGDIRLPDAQGELVHQRPQDGSDTGITGFATKWSQYCTGELKLNTFSQSPRRRGAKRNIVHILGIAADEPERVARYIDKPGYLLPLVEADWHEGLCGLWCQYEGMLSPVYENACRSGCWFCHNQGVEQLRLLRRNYPDLWALLLKWDKDSPVTFKADGHTVHDFDRRFAMEDEGLIPTNRTFRWAMLDNPPKFVAEEGEQIDMNQWLSACRKVRVLSLFDGMACGMAAMQEAGIEVDRYVAFEIDKYAVQTSSHNSPMIEHRGDVFGADFAEFIGFDFLVGGSPCTYWSIAQKNGRETEASGMGWELFCQYVRALREIKPWYFIYENNKSMSKAIRQSISDTFGFEPICINSALVSAQNRQRLYWVGKRNEDGTYSQVHVDQPEDRGILLRDVLDGALGVGEIGGKSYAQTATYGTGSPTPENTLTRHQRSMVAEPVASTVLNINPSGKGINGAVGRIDAKSRCLTTNKGEGMKIIVPCEPVCVAQRGRYTADGGIDQHYEAQEDGKTNVLTTVQKDNNVCEPVRVGNINKGGQGDRIYSTDAKSCAIKAQPGGAGGHVQGLYAIPVEFDGERPTKAISGADGKTYPVYEVRGGQITIKGKQYPIKLPDGFYIIRKLTVNECKRLQTVPEWYEFPVSDSQAYKMLGNGWTVAVIAHLIRAIMEENEDG